MNDKRSIGKIEGYYLKFRRNVIHTSLEDIEDTEWFWAPSEIKKFDRLWKAGTPIKEMAIELGRSEVAVFLLSLDRLYNKKIKPRDWHIW